MLILGNWHHPNGVAVFLHGVFFVFGDNDKIFAMQFAGAFRYRIHFAFAGAFRFEAVANLDELLHLCPVTEDEISFFVVG